jgi:hypothetical protein
MQPGWMDPIAKDNIMLKAYLLQLGAAHEMLYGDRKYDQPGAFTFFYRGQGMGNGLVKFRYSLGDIATNIHDEVVASGYVGSSCEPARIFWACQAPSSVGFMHYDHVHGTHYDVLPKMKDSWVEKGFMDPKIYRASEVIITAWDNRAADQKSVPLSPMVRATSVAGAACSIMPGWGVRRGGVLRGRSPDRNEALQFYLEWRAGRRAYCVDDRAARTVGGLGDFFAYAAEVGDKEAVDKMLAYAQRNYNPVWENGEYYYPRNDDYSADE